MFIDCTDTTRATHVDDVEFERLRGEVRKKVWEFIDGMRAGAFRVKPSRGKVTCKFCDYSAVCRYDTYRISRKRHLSKKVFLFASLRLGVRLDSRKCAKTQR